MIRSHVGIGSTILKFPKRKEKIDKETEKKKQKGNSGGVFRAVDLKGDFL
jgi:hypothetical protein